MKLKFLCTCQDKHTGKMYKHGEAYDFEEARAAEILATGHAVKVGAVEMPKAPEEEPKEEREVETRDDLEMINLETLTVNELRKLAKEMGISTKGTKKELIELIAESAEHA